MKNIFQGNMEAVPETGTHKTEIGEREVESVIEYGNEQRLRCVYKIITTKVGTEFIQNMVSFIISTPQGEINLFDALHIDESILVKIVSREDGQCVAFFDRSGTLVKQELHISEPKTAEDFALLLHEVGHLAQNVDEDFLLESGVNNTQYMRLIAGGQAAEQGFRAFSYAWFNVRKVLLSIPRTAIRERFRDSFDGFLLKLPEIFTLFDQFYELEGERCELEARRIDENGPASEIKDQETEREKELEQLIRAVASKIPMQEIAFFLTEPIRHRERDATHRAVVWLKSFGEQLGIQSLQQLDDAGTRRLFVSLDSYNHGCVKGVIPGKD